MFWYQEGMQQSFSHRPVDNLGNAQWRVVREAAIAPSVDAVLISIPTDNLDEDMDSMLIKPERTDVTVHLKRFFRQRLWSFSWLVSILTNRVILLQQVITWRSPHCPHLGFVEHVVSSASYPSPSLLSYGFLKTQVSVLDVRKAATSPTTPLCLLNHQFKPTITFTKVPYKHVCSLSVFATKP